MGIVERREREKAQRRESIVAAAEDLFYEYGYDKTRMIEIANRCELSKGALYLYFNNKEDLAQAVIVRAYDTIYQLMRDAAARAETGLEQGQAVFEAFVTFYSEHQKQYVLAMNLESHLRRAMEDRVRWAEFFSRMDSILQLAEGILIQGMADGTIRSDLDPRRTAMTFLNAAQGFFYHITFYRPVMDTNHYDTEDLVRELLRLLLNSLT